MKTLFIFDFDDTLALTNSHVIVNDSLRLSSRDFAKYRAKPDDKLDFSEFMDVKDGSLIQSTVDAMQQAIDLYGYENVYIVTARSEATPVQRFLRGRNVEVPEIVATGGSEGKARWLIQRLMDTDYKRVVVYEDCKKNIEMLKDVVDTYNEETGQRVDYTSVCVVMLGESKMRLTMRQLRKIIQETIELDLEKGDVILTGKFKNKRKVVKDIGKDDLGQLTINGRKALSFRIEKLMPKEKWSKKSKEALEFADKVEN